MVDYLEQVAVPHVRALRTGIGISAREGRAGEYDVVFLPVYDALNIPVHAGGKVAGIACAYDGNVRIDKSLCTGCGLCSKVCPVSAIEGGSSNV